MRYILISVFSFFPFALLFSQDFEAQNITVFPGDYNSHEDIYIDQNRNNFVAGQASGAIDFDFGPGINTLPETSFKDLYLAKYNSSSELEWLLSFDGDVTTNQIRAMVSDEDGNIYVSGAFEGTLNLTKDGQNEITSIGPTSMFVAKFDMDGNLIWQFTVGDSDFAQFPDEMYIYNNRLIIQFVYSGTFDVDPGPDSTMLSGTSNAMLIYDLDGNFVEVYSHKRNTTVTTSAMDAEGNLYIGGMFSGLVTFDYKSNFSIISTGLFDAYIAKYDNEFNIIWLKTIGKTFESMFILELDIDSNMDIVVAGFFASDSKVGSDTVVNDATYLTNVSKEGDFMSLTEILPHGNWVQELSINSKDQIILNSIILETIDIDPSSDVQEVTPMDDFDNSLLTVFDSDHNLLGFDQSYATTINSRSMQLDNDDNLYFLTDFKGEGKVAFGSLENYEATLEENFIYYKLDIDECSTSEEDIELSACDQVFVNGQVYEMSGEYQQVLTNSEGCDSVLSITVIIHESVQPQISFSVCEFLETDDEIITESGVYNLPLFNVNGCDSIVELDLIVIKIDNNITEEENELIASETEGDSYQWFDCDTNQPIGGETNSTFAPLIDGTFQVEITKSFCSTFSECVDFFLVGLEEFDFEFSISPNPTQGVIYIKTDNYMDDYNVSLLDLSGKMVISPSKLNVDGMIDIGELTSGMYLLEINNDKQSTYAKIVLY